MRLLFCCEFYHPSVGGVQEVMRQVAERLVQTGHDVTVATTRLPERQQTNVNGVRIQQFRVAGNLAVGMHGEIEQYRRFVLDFAADAVLIKAAQQWTFDALWPVLDHVRGRKVFIPCGFSGLHVPLFADYFEQLPAILRKFDHLIFYSEKHQDIAFARRHGLQRMSVLPNGASEIEFERPADPSIRAKLGIDAADFLFLTVGTPIAVKGHSDVLDAFTRLDTGGRPTTLVLNGDWAELLGGHWRKAWISAWRRGWVPAGLAVFPIRRAGTVIRNHAWREFWIRIREAERQPGKKVLCTNLPRQDLVDLFKAADLFVFASKIEYSPLVLFEAAAAGTAFLSTPVGNAEEIARWTGAGIICPADKDRHGYTQVDPAILATEIQRCMNNPEMLAKLSRVGQETWHRRFTWAAIVPSYEAILAGSARLRT